LSANHGWLVPELYACTLQYYYACLGEYSNSLAKVEVGPNSSKQQLLDAVGRHFMSQELDEFQVITGFMQAAKRLKV
jgi:hypothetical protein